MDACVRVALLGWLTLDDVPLVEQALFVRLAVCEPQSTLVEAPEVIASHATKDVHFVLD